MNNPAADGLHPRIVQSKSFKPHPVLWTVLPIVLITALFAPASSSATGTTTSPSQASWTLIWTDEFNGPGGVNPSNWIYDIGTGYPGGPANWGTGEVEVMTNSANNIFQNNGYLNIRALHSGVDPIQGWTSGRIETVSANFEPSATGEMAVEARIQLPNLTGLEAQGYWPAFWMLGAPYRGNYWNWPGIGEIDIMENVNGENRWRATLHCGTVVAGPCNEPDGIGGTATGFSPSLQSAFHVYRMELDRSTSPQQIRWYVDGIQRFIVYSNQVDATTWSNATSHGFFIILDVAIGGRWSGNPTSSTVSGGTMLVDYVRVYVRPGELIYLPLITKDHVFGLH